MSTEVEKQEGQKTVVSFAAGLLIGGLLVWAFSGTPQNDESAVETGSDEPAATLTNENDEGMTTSTGDDTTETDEGVSDDSSVTTGMEMGDASATVASNEAGYQVELTSATFPTQEGWIGVRTYNNGMVGSILGVSRYSQEQGLVPSTIELLSPTVAGREYAVVYFNEDGDRDFDPALDAQMEGEVLVFTAE